MKKLIVFASFLIICTNVFSQNSIKNTIADYATNNKLSIARPFKDSVTIDKPNNLIVLNKEHWDLMGLNELELFSDIFEYSIFAVYKHKNNLILMISRDYPSETIHWICIVDKNLNLKDYLMTAYENDEGNIYVTSEISKNALVIYKWELEDNESGSSYSIKKDKFEGISSFVKIEK